MHQQPQAVSNAIQAAATHDMPAKVKLLKHKQACRCLTDTNSSRRRELLTCTTHTRCRHIFSKLGLHPSAQLFGTAMHTRVCWLSGLSLTSCQASA